MSNIVKKLEVKLSMCPKLNDGPNGDLVLKPPFMPIWIADEINIDYNSHIIVLDDDYSIHDVWHKLFSGTLKDNTGITLVDFTRGEECLEYINSHKASNKLLLLADYELINQAMNGLDVIELSSIEKAILVTSHYEDKGIIKRSILLKTRILPKVLIANIKLNVIKELESYNQDVRAIDLVLLEDNKELASVLTYLNEMKNKNIVIYHTPYELLEALPRHDRETKICLDYDLSCPVNGVELAALLHKKGYEKIYLATGFQLDQKDLPVYITLLKEKMDLINL